MAEYFVESALLAQGLKSISEEQLVNGWKEKCDSIVWMEKGKIQVGGIRKFCEFRKRTPNPSRIHYQNFEDAVSEKATGALTASGAIKVCERYQVPLVVTCGIGGLMKGEDYSHCHDILALHESQVSMVATSPKDMFDMKTTISEIQRAGISVCGRKTETISGYLFIGSAVSLDRKWQQESIQKHTLYLNPIEEDDRLKDLNILKEAVLFGKEAQKQGKYYHPAVNGRIDDLSEGQSSVIQLRSLLDNIEWAKVM